MKTLLTILLILQLPIQLKAQRLSFVEFIRPDFVQAQFAGNVGLAAAGVGYRILNERLYVSLLNGYTPASISGSAVNIVAIKAAYAPVSIKTGKVSVVPYVGLGGNFETSGNAYYILLPARFSDGYYFMSAAHASVFAGARLAIPYSEVPGRRIEVFAETGTLDTYAYYWYKNQHIPITQIFSSALGLNWHFGIKRR